MALHNALTGLPKRVLLEDRLKIALRMQAIVQMTEALGIETVAEGVEDEPTTRLLAARRH